jgi:hypothetical protein
MKTHDERIRVTNHGRENWRTEVQDEPGAEWSITGPPYPTRAEALVNVPRVAAECFGEARPASRADHFTPDEVDALIATAGDLYSNYGDANDVLSRRQRDLATRAYDLLSE